MLVLQAALLRQEGNVLGFEGHDWAVTFGCLVLPTLVVVVVEGR